MRLLATCLSLFLAGCSGLEAVPAPARPVTLGYVGELTGPGEAGGRAALAAAELAAETVNAAGGVNRQPLAILARDEAAPGGAAAQAAALAREGVVALLTPGDATAFGEGPDLPVIAGAGATVWGEAGGEAGRLFRTAPSDRQAVQAMARAIEGDGHRRVAVLTRDRPAARAMAEELELLLGETRASLAIYEDTETPEADAVLAEVPHDATAVVFFGEAPDGAVLLRQWAAGHRRALRWYFAPGLEASALAALAGAGPLEGHLGAAPAGGSEAHLAFAAAYRARTGRAPRAADARAYDGVMLAALALARGGENSREALERHMVAVSRTGENPPGQGAAGFRAAIAMLSAGRGVNYDGASGTLDLDDAGQARADFVVWRWQGGRPVDTARRFRF